MGDTQRASWWYISLVSEIGLVIAVPMVASGFIGRWMDRQLGTSPWLTLALLVVGTIMSVFNFASVVKKITMQ